MTVSGGPGHPLPYGGYVEAIERETERLAAAVRGADPATAVPDCPGWTLTDLVRHTGMVQRRFSLLLALRVQEPPRRREMELNLPDRAEEYADWLVDGLPETLAVLRATEPEAGMWAWGPDQHARFWARRMLFETLVHRVDAERAVGSAGDVDAVLASDGVDEFLANLPSAGSFAPDTAKLRGSGEVIVFRCTDAAAGGGEHWRVRLDPDGFGVEPDTAAGAVREDAVVRGRAADLLLLVYGRLPYGAAAFEISGNRDLLDRWFAHSAF